jgi:hypothetical protein
MVYLLGCNADTAVAATSKEFGLIDTIKHQYEPQRHYKFHFITLE